MRIGFDAKRLYSNFTGLGNYSRFVVGGLHTYYPNNNYILFTPSVKVNADTQPFLQAPDLQTVLPSPWVSSLKLKSLWRTFYLGKVARKYNLDIYHGLSHELPLGISHEIKTVLTVHDLIFIRYPQFYNKLDAAIYKSKIHYACKRADVIIAISEQTRQDIIDFLRINPAKIRVVYQGCHPNFNREFTADALAGIKVKYHLPSDYILTVGTIEERKNVLLIVKALALLKDRVNTPLVIVGKPTPYLEKIKVFARANGVEHRIVYLHQVVFADLPGIYRQAKLFVYPSLFEGFGIPLVEAIACGVPVISSTGSCFREAAGPDSIYVDPANPEELAFQMEKALSDSTLRENANNRSGAYIKRFKSENIAADILQVYQSLL